jgi:enoyl-[acyl-carrier protein] reductase II
VIDGDVENGSLMAGQSVGMVTREQPTMEILNELVAQAVGALVQRSGFAGKPDHGASYRAEIVSGAPE